MLPEVDNDNVVSMYEGTPISSGPSATGREIGVEDLWIKLCGNSHTGSFKDLGMTVLVSMVKEMIARGKDDPRGGLRVDGRYLGGAGRLRGGRGHPGGGLPAQGQDLAGPADPARRQRRHRLRPRHGLRRLHGDREEGGRARRRLSRELDEQPAHRGQKTISPEIVQQFGWEVPDWLIIPGGNLGNVSALAKGLDLLLDLGIIDRKPRICVAQAEAANPLYLSYLKDFEVFEPVAARTTVASAIQIGNPSPSTRPWTRSGATTGWWSRRARPRSTRPARPPTAPASSTAPHRSGAGRPGEARRARPE